MNRCPTKRRRPTSASPLLILAGLLLTNSILPTSAGSPFISRNVALRHAVGTDAVSVISELRGGATSSRPRRGKKKAKVASLSSSGSKSTSKTATGKKKVGGAAEAADKAKKSSSDTLGWYKNMPPLTKGYFMLGVLSAAVATLLGEETYQSLFALDPIRVVSGFEIWRIVSAAGFFGGPSVRMLLNLYNMFRNGSSLERATGGPQHLVFLVTQITMLALLSMLLGLPSFGPSVATAMLYVLSRATPHRKVKVMVIDVEYHLLPYATMFLEALQAQNAMALIPHILGVLSGHFYYFHKSIWPKVGGQDWLVPPEFLVRRLDPDSRKEAASKEKLNKALKSRKRRKGRKLGCG